MTVRDWLQLLIVPLALVVIGFLFTAQQDQRQQKIEDQRAEQAQKIENQRAEAERELAEQRAQDEALQAYLNQMSMLLLEKNLRNSGSSEEDTEVRTLARARTLTVLGRLDPSRKKALIQFLVEADLVQRVDRRDPIISLRSADLSDANLSDAKLSLAFDLSGADLIDANLNAAYLGYTTLSYANALLVAHLSDANLNGADLRGADLGGGLRHNFLTKPANLSGADLSGANLSGADLSGSTTQLGDQGTITNEELEQQAASLEGATMPNGQKYEDWRWFKDN